ncbi:LacI family DNA-binding transcriptional regulator [Marinomonas sp. 15G1-11]|uniref:LacI family DNA-binding transcriptional regulator n=1 Tax=Marinomonas phaeophyticola TaxID=3004091 RepID=A0ABT4JPJ7_9GAMM|nr:LacI family DNA-binding transcriptional regulator [Marinomonas sp. 15G1-11]MCZ2720150.1 LacI family DNA-binding transcriptional regulator [Marinomonas sp. 15G1-11]
MATVKDVARLAGVSTATVSRALANPEIVSPSTREKVEKAALDVGYSPNGLARSLRKSESKTIVVVLPNIDSTFFSDVVHGIEALAHKHGYKLLIGDTGNESSRIGSYFELFESKLVDGVLSLSSDIPESMIINAQGEIKLPIVIAGEYFSDIAVPTVHIDNNYSAKKGVEYLIMMGHHKIACITGKIENPVFNARTNGYKETMKKWKLPITESYILESDLSFISGYNLGRQLLSLKNPPSAIVCHSDEAAIGVLKIAREMQVAVPSELSVIGFDNLALSEYCVPELTTIHQPRQLIGETSMKLLLDILSGKKPNPEMTLPTQLIVRESSCPPPIDQRLQVDL